MCAKISIISVLSLYAVCICWGCSPETPKNVIVQDTDPMKNPQADSQNSINNSTSENEQTVQYISQPQECEPKGQDLSCFCKDGTNTGIQHCDSTGYLHPCSGCPTTTPSSTSEPYQPQGGQLCEKLKEQIDCKAKSFQAEELPTSILFVVDRSGSMSCNPPPIQDSESCETAAVPVDETQPSKWEITVNTLKTVLGQLKGSGASAGLMFFSNDNSCGAHSDLTIGGVPLEVISESHLGLLSNRLDNQTPEGGTPLVGATILAYSHLHQEAGGNCAQAPCGALGNRFVVLITDGVDSCPDPGYEGAPCGPNSIACTNYLLETEVPKAIWVNIRTYVIGAPGSELGRGFLSELAYQGGTAKRGGDCSHSDPSGTTGDCHYDMTETQDFAADLSEALLDISGAALGCEFSVPTASDNGDPENVNVQYTLTGQGPICLARDDQKPCDDGANGWQFAKHLDGSNDLEKVVLCGDACELVKNNPDVKVDVILGCQPIVVLE